MAVTLNSWKQMFKGLAPQIFSRNTSGSSSRLTWIWTQVWGGVQKMAVWSMLGPEACCIKLQRVNAGKMFAWVVEVSLTDGLDAQTWAKPNLTNGQERMVTSNLALSARSRHGSTLDAITWLARNVISSGVGSALVNMMYQVAIMVASCSPAQEANSVVQMYASQFSNWSYWSFLRQ